MDRVFLDANVLFSAAYRSDAGLLVLWRRGSAAMITSAYSLDEARRNLPSDDQRRRLDALAGACEIVLTPAAAALPQGLCAAARRAVDLSGSDGRSRHTSRDR